VTHNILTVLYTYMSLATFAKKGRVITSPQSRGKDGFSLVGGYRNGRGVGNIDIMRTPIRTPFRGDGPVGHGGCCDTYRETILGGSCCTNDSKVIKKASKSTKGMLATRFARKWNEAANEFVCPRVVFNTTYPYTWVQPQGESGGERIARLSRSIAECVPATNDAGPLDCSGSVVCTTMPRAGSRLMPRTPFTKTTNNTPMSYRDYNRGQLMKNNCLFTEVVRARDKFTHFPMNVGNGACTKAYNTPAEAQAAGLLPSDYVG